MAQTGNFTPILLYASSTPGNVPLAARLTNSTDGSEIAINIADKNLFFKDSGGTVNTVPIRQSGTSSNGWLSSTDWNTFNNKAPATSGTSLLYGNGTGGFSNVTIGSGISFAGGTLSATGTGGTVTSVAALTLGTTGTDLSSTVANGTTTPVITLNVPTASATNRGALSSTDWSTFNGKQAALVSGTNIKTVGGVSLLGSGDVGTIGVGYGGTGLTTLTAGYIPYGAGTAALGSSANLFWNTGTNTLQISYLGVGTTFQSGYYAAINGDIWVGNTGGVQIGKIDNAAGWFDFNGSANVNGAQISASGAVRILPNNAESARFFTSGGVSIGNTTDPGATNLSVNGSAFVGATSSTGTIGNTSVLLGGIHRTVTGSVSATTGVATTIVTLPSVGYGAWLVTAAISGAADVRFQATSLIFSQGSSVSSFALGTGAFMTISLSGLNVQATQSSGVTLTITWNVVRIA